MPRNYTLSETKAKTHQNPKPELMKKERGRKEGKKGREEEEEEEGGGRRKKEGKGEAEGGDRAAYNPNLLSLSAITFTIDLWAAGKNGGGAINYKTPMRSTANRRARYTC